MQKLTEFYQHCINETGSSRPAALFRMAIAAIVMMRHGPEMTVFMASTAFELVFCTAFFIFVPLAFFGLWSRISLPAVAGILVIDYYGPLLGLTDFGGISHHQYVLMVASVLLCFMPAAKSYSIDRILEYRSSGQLPEERGSLAAQRLMVLQLCAIYFWTAIDKTNPEFMSGDRLERIMEWFYASSDLHPIMTWKPLLMAASIGVVLVEYALPVFILMRRRLAMVFAIAVLMHGAFFFLIVVHTYSVTMLAVYLLVANPDWLHRQMDIFAGKQGLPANG